MSTIHQFSFLLACSSWVACAAVASEAYAQTPASSTTRAEDEAQRFYSDANAAFKREAWVEAEALYLKAWALSKSFDVAANLGETEIELGKHREAATFLSFSLRTAPPSSKSEQRDRTRASLEQAKKKVLTIKLTTNVPNAAIALDGVAIDAVLVGSEMFALPGKRVVEASAAGYRSVRRTVEGGAGAVLDVRLSLLPEEEKEQRSKLPGYILGGAGAAGLVAAGVLFGVYEGKRAEIRDKGTLDDAGKPLCARPPSAGGGEACDAVRALGSEANALGNAGIVMLALGGAAVAGGVLYLLWPGSKANSPHPASVVLPVAHAGGAGVIWTGSF